MHIVPLFPGLLAYQAIGPFIIRLIVGFTLFHFGIKKMFSRGDSSGSNSAAYGFVEVLISLLFIVGLFTQLAALLNAIILIIKLGFKLNERKFLSDGVNYYLLLLAMVLSLFFTGPGAFAFDMTL